jgi:hypothetical protein
MSTERDTLLQDSRRDTQTGEGASDYYFFSSILKTIQQKVKSLENVLDELWEDSIGFLEYAVVINGLFVNKFLNKNAYVTAANIEIEKKELENQIIFFTKWRLEARAILDVNWWRPCIAAKTYMNLRRLVSGFVQYCEIVIF